MHTPTMSIFCVTYHADLPWIPWLLKSISKYCRDFHEVVIAIPNRDKHLLDAYGLTKERIVTFDEDYDGFAKHMEIICRADEFCEGNIILHIDSDCWWSAPTTPHTYLDEINKVINFYSDYRRAPVAQDCPTGWWPGPWKAGTERVLGCEVTVECMRRHPSVLWRGSYKEFRDHVQKIHGKTIGEYLRPLKRSMPRTEDNFSEFNALVGYAKIFGSHGYHWVNAESEEAKLYPSNVIQSWSFHGVDHPDVMVQLFRSGLLEEQKVLFI